MTHGDLMAFFQSLASPEIIIVFLLRTRFGTVMIPHISLVREGCQSAKQHSIVKQPAGHKSLGQIYQPYIAFCRLCVLIDGVVYLLYGHKQFIYRWVDV